MAGDRRFRALHFALAFFPVYGGMSARLFNMLSDGVHRHSLYVPRSPSSYIPRDLEITQEEEVFDNIHVRRCRIPLQVPSRVPVWDYVSLHRYHRRAAGALRRHVADEPIDLVYGHGPMEFALAAIGEARDRRLPLIYEVHGLHHDNLWSATGWTAGYHRMMQRPILAMEKRILRKARIIIVQTARIEERIRSVYGLIENDIRVIYNGVDAEKFSPERLKEASAAYRRKMGWENKVVFLYSGLLDRINGVDLLLEAVKRLPENVVARVRVVLAGRGGLSGMVEAAARHHPVMEYLGLVPYEAMPRLMGAADIFVIPRPSTLPAETLVPVKLLEAMAMERVPLVSAVGGMTEVVDDGETGIVFTPGDSDGLVERITALSGTKGRLDEMGARARKRMADAYSWSAAHRKLDRIYREVCGCD